MSIDGNAAGTTPITVSIAPGKHLISVQKEGYVGWEQELRLGYAERRTASVALTFIAYYQQLTYNERDRAAVWVDDITFRFYRQAHDQGFVGQFSGLTEDIDLYSITPVSDPYAKFFWSPSRASVLIRQGRARIELWLWHASTRTLAGFALPDITDWPTWDFKWTTDESELIIIRDREQRYHDFPPLNPKMLARIDIKTKQMQQIAELPSWSADIVLSPSENMAIVTRQLEPSARESFNLLSVRLADGAVRELPARGNEALSWSPDGKRMAFFARYSVNDVPEPSLWVAEADGGGSRRIATVPRYARGYAWMPDSEHILLDDLTLANVNTGEIRKLPFTPDKTAATYRRFGPLSPDGKKVLLETDKGLGMIILGE